MLLRKQPDESSDASEQSSDEAAPRQARCGSCDAGLKSYKSSLDGKFHTISLPSNNRKQKQAVASTLAPMLSDCKFVWHVHNFALFKTLNLFKKLRMTASEPHACYSFLQPPPPEIDLEGFDFSHRELFVKRKRRANGRFARGQASQNSAFFSATASALTRIGGGALVSWLIHVLVTGKNLPDRFYAQRVRQNQRCCARDSKAVLSRRYWGICSNIKVIHWHTHLHSDNKCENLYLNANLAFTRKRVWTLKTHAAYLSKSILPPFPPLLLCQPFTAWSAAALPAICRGELWRI
jgi:hypothetical protein